MQYEILVNANDRFYVAGIGTHHSDTLAPYFSFETLDEARLAAKHAEEGFKQGYEKARRDIRSALGV